MKKIANIFLILITTTLLLNCEDSYVPAAADYVTFGDTVYSAGVDPGGATTIDIPVYYASVTKSAKTFNVTVDGSAAADGSYNVPGSVVIEAGTNKGTLTVALSDTNLGIGVNKITLNFETVAGLSDGGSTTIEYMQNCNEVTGTLDISLDYYSSETGWQIIDSLGGVVLSKDYSSDGIWSVSEDITLCAGRNYTLVFTDVYGDGMNDGTNLGSYTLTIGGVVKVTGGGNFGASESTAFDTN